MDQTQPEPEKNKDQQKIKLPKPKKEIIWSRFFAKGFIVFGILSILDFFSPIPIPTTFGVAIVSGIIFIGIGSLMLFKDRIPWGKLATGAAKVLVKPQPLPEPVHFDPLLPVNILKLAKENKGILTLSMVAMELNTPLDQAEAGLNECIKFGHAVADFDMKKEITIYSFHEHLA